MHAVAHGVDVADLQAQTFTLSVTRGTATRTRTAKYVTIATAKGNLQARPAGTLTTGDRVIVRAGWAEKVPVATASYSV